MMRQFIACTSVCAIFSSAWWAERKEKGQIIILIIGGERQPLVRPARVPEESTDTLAQVECSFYCIPPRVSLAAATNWILHLLHSNNGQLMDSLSLPLENRRTF